MNIYEKLLNIQHELKAPKNCRNTFGNYNYRSAEGILEALKPLCYKYKAVLRMTDEIEEKGGKNFVKAIAELIDVEVTNPTHDSIFAIGAQGWAQIPESKKGLDSAQIVGSTSSYARKYCLNALFAIDDQKDSDALPPDKEVEKMEAMEANQARLDATENWRMTNDGIEVKGQKGFVPITKLSVEQLQAIAKMRKFADVKTDIEREIANR